MDCLFGSNACLHRMFGGIYRVYPVPAQDWQVEIRPCPSQLGQAIAYPLPVVTVPPPLHLLQVELAKRLTPDPLQEPHLWFREYSSPDIP